MAAPRTAESAVREIIQTRLDTAAVSAFIADADLWVNEELAPAGLSDDRLELIERYLACAFIRLRELGLTSTSYGDVSEQYQVDSQVTDYLLRAAAFDPTGRVRLAFIVRAGAGGGGQHPTARVGRGYAADADA